VASFCTLCGSTNLADLGSAIGICLDKDACHRRQYIRLRDRADAATARAEAAEADFAAERERADYWNKRWLAALERADEDGAQATSQHVRIQNLEQRAGNAEARLAAIVDACRSIPSPIANRLLAITGTGEDDREPYGRIVHGTPGGLCVLCGNANLADLGQITGNCLDKDACDDRRLAAWFAGWEVTDG
jgi:hypothetical protein